MLGDKLGDKLTENQKLIVTELRKNHSISLAQLSKKIGISQTARLVGPRRRKPTLPCPPLSS